MPILFYTPEGRIMFYPASIVLASVCLSVRQQNLMNVTSILIKSHTMEWHSMQMCMKGDYPGLTFEPGDN